MSAYFILGMNHKTAPVEIREKVAYDKRSLSPACAEILKLPSIEEVIVLSTCNRTEYITYVTDTKLAERELISFILHDRQIENYEDSWFFFERTFDDVVRHVFKVASGLDSMIPGELQITGQLKYAYERAISVGSCGSALNGLIQYSLRTVKLIRNNTNVSNGFVSIGSAAAVLARKVLGDLRDRTALLIGAGEISEITAKNLQKNQIASLDIINRTYSRAEKMADKLGGNAHGFSELQKLLASTDIVISSTGSSQFIVDENMLKDIMKERRNRPIFFIDLAVPRDIDPQAAKLSNVYLSDIDDLEDVIQANIELRKKEVEKAKRIIEEEKRKFNQKMCMRKFDPLITSIQKKAHTIREKELQKFFKKTGVEDKKLKKDIDILTSRIIKKVLHEPIVTARKLSLDDSKGSNYIRLIKQIFNLE